MKNAKANNLKQKDLS